MKLCCGNPEEITVGSRVHSKRLYNGKTRIGGAERYNVLFLSEYNAVVETRRGSDNSWICETTMTRREFNEEYEACPG